MLTKETSSRLLPSGGEGTVFPAGGVPFTAFDTQSFFTQILPFIEEGIIFKQMNPKYVYNDGAWKGNQFAAKQQIAMFLCPSNSIRQPDPGGYGQTDYMPISYTDIDPGPPNPGTCNTIGVRCKTTRATDSADSRGQSHGWDQRWHQPHDRLGRRCWSQFRDLVSDGVVEL